MLISLLGGFSLGLIGMGFAMFLLLSLVKMKISLGGI